GVRRVVPELAVLPEVAPRVLPLVVFEVVRGDLAGRRAEIPLAAERRVVEVELVAEEILDLATVRLEALRVFPRRRRRGLARDAGAGHARWSVVRINPADSPLVVGAPPGAPEDAVGSGVVLHHAGRIERDLVA